jgi:UbiD family decarboxylase
MHVGFPNLSSFINELRRRRDVVEISAEVDPRLEMAEVHRRVIAAGGPALLFTNVKGKKFPVATNLFGTRARAELGLGEGPKRLVAQVADLPEVLLPPTAKGLWRARGVLKSLAKIGMRRQTAPVMRHQIAGADLTALPALTSWAEDGGPFLTLPLVHTPGIGGKPDNLGMYRVQIHDARETGLHFQIGKGGGYHLWEAERIGRDLPVNIYLGGPPALILAAIAPLPENVPEMLLASLVLGKRLGRHKTGVGAADQPDLVSEAEFCLVGHAPQKVRRPEGPFGDHYGYYSLQHDYPVFRPQAIFHRPGAIFPATVVGKPRQEDFFIGDYLQELLLPLIPRVMPGLVDLWSYGETGYHSLAAAVLRERYGREAMATVFRILGEGQLALTKFLLAVDKPMDLKDFRSVLTYALERVDWQKDLFVFSDIAMDTLDYTGPQVNHGSKGVIVGIGEARRVLPREYNGGLPMGVARKIKVFSPGCLVVETASYKDDREAPARLAKDAALAGWQLVVVVDDAEKAAKTEAAFLWTTFTRFEPAADIYAGGVAFARHKAQYTAPIVIDARMKPWYPGELFCDPDTAKTVSRRWSEYFPNGGVAMGDSDAGHLYS